jgi:hypothetical protein
MSLHCHSCLVEALLKHLLFFDTTSELQFDGCLAQ